MRSLLYRAGIPWRPGLLCLILAASPASAQPPVALTIRGRVTDTAGRPLAFATVSLTDSAGQRRHAYALTDIDGRYRITVGTAPTTTPRIRVEHLRMAPAVVELPSVDGSGDVLLPPIPMQIVHQTLEEIVIRAAAAPVVRKGDTVVFAAKAFADAETRKVEDLLRRLPGFQVSSDGRIHVNGREVDRILIDGEPAGAVSRVPGKADHRGNLHVGATAHATTLTAREREICARIGPYLKAEGLLFVGIDVIGEWLTEINVTSPTGLQQINRFDGVQLEERILDAAVARYGRLA